MPEDYAKPSQPQYTGTRVSSLCHLQPRPLLMTGLFRDLLTKHFQADTPEAHELRHLIWRADAQSSILIESIHRWRPQTTERRPAVIIKRNAYSNRRIGIADRHQGNPADRQGNPHFSTYWMGSHTLFCIGGSGAQAELLGGEVQRYFTQNGHIIQRSLRLMRFQTTEVNPVGELEESTESFCVPVVVAYAYEESWKLVQQAPVLSRVSLSMILDC